MLRRPTEPGAGEVIGRTPPTPAFIALLLPTLPLLLGLVPTLVSSCPGLFFGAEGRAAETRALFSLIVAASTVFCRLKLLPPLLVTVPPVTAGA